MKNETALSAAQAVHETIINDDAFCGYEGTPEAFDLLLFEVQAIADCFIEPIDALKVDKLVDAWFEVQNEILEGNLEVDWYLSSDFA